MNSRAVLPSVGVVLLLVEATVFAEPRPLKVATNKLAETKSAATIMVAKIGRMPLLDWPFMPMI
jgi:hypothetical protein